jgi:hypothetical protein
MPAASLPWLLQAHFHIIPIAHHRSSSITHNHFYTATNDLNHTPYPHHTRDTMSLSKVPTEIDLKIAQYVYLEDLASLSQVSKHYQTVAEEILYKVIHLDINDWGILRRLLLTLIKRPKLALNITAFDFSSHWREIPADNKGMEAALHKETWEAVSSIRDRIDQIMINEEKGSQSTKLAHDLLGQLFSSTNGGKDDSTIALILCMATNLENMEVCVPSRMTDQVLAFPWQSAENRPFGKLKHMGLCGCSTACDLPVVILPTLEILVIQNWESSTPLRFTEVVVYPAPMPSTPMLKTVHFNTVMVDPDYVAQMIKSDWFANLKSLEIQSVLCPGSADDSDDEDGEKRNMIALLRSMEKYTPKVETFDWCAQLWASPGDEKVDTFRKLEHLRGLVIDYDRLPSANIWQTALWGPRSILPDTVKDLYICGIPTSAMESAVNDFLDDQVKDAEDITDRDEVRARAQTLFTRRIKEIALELSLKNFALEVVLEMENQNEPDDVELYELAPYIIQAFRSAADDLEKRGVTFQLFREAGKYEAREKLLVGPGFTAPTPHSVWPPVPPEEVVGEVVEE